eukprot:4143075-Amphidinium_carterae.5
MGKTRIHSRQCSYRFEGLARVKHAEKETEVQLVPTENNNDNDDTTPTTEARMKRVGDQETTAGHKKPRTTNKEERDAEGHQLYMGS